KDEGAVPDPSARAPAIPFPWLHAKGVANPAKRLIDGAVLIGSEVEDVDRIVRAVDRHPHRVDAIVHVEIRFALRPVTQHVDLVRVGQQFPVEIEDAAVGVATAKNRHEPEDVALKAEACSVSLDQPLTSELRRTVEARLDGKRAGLRRRKYLGFTV